MYDKLTSITPNASALANDLQTNTQSDMTALKAKTTTAKGELEVLPNSNPNTNFVLLYTNPTPRSLTSQVASQYSSLLGNSGARTSLCGALYNGIVGLDTLLNAAVTGLANYNNAAFTSSINTVMQSIQDLSKDVTAMDSSIAPKLKPVKSFIEVLDALLVLYYVLVIIVVGLILAYVAITKRFRELFPCLCKQITHQAPETFQPMSKALKNAIGIIFYVTYGAMLATGFLGMLLMAAFGIVVPTIHMSCVAVTNGIASPAAFNGKSLKDI